MEYKEKLKQYREFLSENEDKIILFIGFALVAFLSFGAGKISEISQPEKQIVFKDSTNCQISPGLSPSPGNPATPGSTMETGKIIGNKNSKIYHLPGGASYEKISPANRAYFATEEDAQKAGYRKAKN